MPDFLEMNKQLSLIREESERQDTDSTSDGDPPKKLVKHVTVAFNQDSILEALVMETKDNQSTESVHESAPGTAIGECVSTTVQWQYSPHQDHITYPSPPSSQRTSATSLLQSPVQTRRLKPLETNPGGGPQSPRVKKTSLELSGSFTRSLMTKRLSMPIMHARKDSSSSIHSSESKLDR